MPKKIKEINGIGSHFKNLTGVSLRYISAPIEATLPLCSEKKSCKVKDFNKQRKLCQDVEISAVYKFKGKKYFKIHKFKCGLSEIILSVSNNGSALGVVLSNKIKRENNRSHRAGNSRLPCLDSKQIYSLVSLLNIHCSLFKETIVANEYSYPKTKDKVLIKRATKIIEKEYHNSKLPLSEVAREVSSSYFYVCRLFKRELNLSFIQYLTLVRLRAAFRLLGNLNLTVTQISYAVGFNDVEYFYRVFRKVLNCSPKDYRFSSVVQREKIKQKVLSRIAKI